MTKRISITIDEALVDRVDAAIENSGESREGYVAEAVRRRLGDVPTGPLVVPRPLTSQQARGHLRARPKPSAKG